MKGKMRSRLLCAGFAALSATLMVIHMAPVNFGTNGLLLSTVSRARSTFIAPPRQLSRLVGPSRIGCERRERPIVFEEKTWNGGKEEWGARDPFAAETEFDFGNKIPKNHIFGLQNDRYSANKTALNEEEQILFQNQIPGFEIEFYDGREMLTANFLLPSEDELVELKTRVEAAKIAPGLENNPNLEWTIDIDRSTGEVEADLRIQSDGTEGPVMNDFILAGYVNKMELG
eukprot:jgi/Bigna1/75214/fgenesh1_pg.33_\